MYRYMCMRTVTLYYSFFSNDTSVELHFRNFPRMKQGNLRAIWAQQTSYFAILSANSMIMTNF